MPRKRNPLAISCDSSDCASGLHCFKATKEMAAQNRVGVCRECGAGLIDWPRVHQRALGDIENTFTSLKHEFIRHVFWHKPLNQYAINHARKKGKKGLRQIVRKNLTTAIGAAHPFHDGFQTTMKEDVHSVVPFGQHATATCCRKCLEYWHGIPQGQPLSDTELDYLTELVCLYIEDRIPELTRDGERIPPIRRKQ
jgi:Domain of unknown function (DUF4186)